MATWRDILTAVAEGRISPQEAAARLEEAGEPPPQMPQQEPQRRHERSISRVQVRGGYRRVRVLGDPTVAEAVATGPHTARREGDLLVISGEDVEADGEGFQFGFGAEGIHVARLGRWWSWNVPAHRERELVVRMNPSLAAELEVSAGSLSVTGLAGPLTVEVAAGSARLDDIRHPFDLVVRAGSVKVSALLDGGASSIHCDAGSVSVDLERGSSVKIRARTSLGKVVLADQEAGGPDALLFGGGRELTVGDGAGTLDIEATMGNVRVRPQR